MKNALRLILATMLVVGAAACGGGSDTPDTGTPGKVDGGPTCAAAKKCGSACCSSTQECINGTCETCGCGSGDQCGDDACGNSCGTCQSPQICNTATKKCETGTCPAAQVCGSGCCTASQKCVAGACTNCGCGTRVCGTDACGNTCGTSACSGATPICNEKGQCVSQAQACDGVTCAQQGETCDTADGKCKCSTSGTPACASGYSCDSATRKCTPTTTDKCAGVTCSDSTKPQCDSADGVCKCTSTSCGAGQSCVSGVCQASGTCNPACSQGENCNAGVCQCTVATSTAKDSCNVAAAGFVCNGKTKRCESLSTTVETCNGSACAPGQICADPVTWDPNSTSKVCTCLPARYADATKTTELPDSCLYLGKTCDYGASEDGPWTCKAPNKAWEECATWATPQCDSTKTPGLTCESLSYSGQTFYICLQKCTSTTATATTCTDPTEKCQTVLSKTFCYPNYCVDPESTNATMKDRTKYFQPCAAAGASDGICLPFPAQNAAGDGLIDNGYCYQTGTATGECDPNALRPNTAGLCGAGKFCDLVQGGPNGTLKGVCRDVCNAAIGATTPTAITPTPVKNCTAGSCQDYSWWFGADYQTSFEDFPYSLMGICEPACNIYTAATCPADALGNPAGCQPDFMKINETTGAFDGSGYCTALAPSAKAAGATCGAGGATCTTDADCTNGTLCGTSGKCIDLRKECDGTMFCDKTSTQCVGFCNVDTCPTATNVCTSCLPNTAKCTSLGTITGGGPIKLGTCTP